MAGSHRAPGPARRGPSARGIVVAIVAVAAVVGGTYAVLRPDADEPADTRGVEPPTPTPSSLPTVVMTPSATPTADPAKPSTAAKPARLPRVTASAPRRFVVRGLVNVGFDSAVAPRDGVFSAGSTAEVARWGGRGLPASPGDDTVFVIGKVSSGGALARLPAAERGTRIVLQTARGSLSYTVQKVETKPARGLTRDRAFTARVPGRLQVVGIRYGSDGERTGSILVVTAQLTNARPSS